MACFTSWLHRAKMCYPCLGTVTTLGDAVRLTEPFELLSTHEHRKHPAIVASGFSLRRSDAPQKPRTHRGDRALPVDRHRGEFRDFQRGGCAPTPAPAIC